MSRFCAGPGCARTRRRVSRWVGVAALVLVAAAAPARAHDEQIVHQKVVVDTRNPAGVLRTVAMDGVPMDASNPFFLSLGTNGRSCQTCHVPQTGWTISPNEVQQRFRQSDGLDALFRTVDGSNSPRANLRTTKARRDAFSMLLNRGVIRVGLPVPANAEFELAAVDDPYGFASAAELSLFRRPLPTTNIRFITAVMWDGRESFGPLGTTPIRADATPEANAEALFDNLMHQANDATTGHAQGAPISEAQQIAIAAFELNLATAQHTDRDANRLDGNGAFGGAEHLAGEEFYVTINDVLGADALLKPFESHSMTLFDSWANARNPARAAVARGAALFGAQRIDITGVGGLNDDLGVPLIQGSCTTCHDSPNVGNHSVPLAIDIGLTEPSRRTPDMPLYTLRNKSTGETRQTTDPARALLTGRWKDIARMKGPVLRGLAARAPYFHDGQAADLGAVIDFYNTRFDIGFTAKEKADLIAFLNAL